MLRIRLLPEAHFHPLREPLQLRFVQGDKDLIGGRHAGLGNSLFPQGGPDPVRLPDRDPAQLFIQAVGKEGIKLEPGDAALGQQGALLLDLGKDMGGGAGLREDQGFPEEGAALGAADIEGVAEAGQIRQGDVVFPAGQGIGQAGAVHIEQQIVFQANPADLLQLAAAVQSAVFRGLGEIDHAGGHQVVPVSVLPPGAEQSPQGFSADLAVPLGQGEHLVAAVLDGAGLMGADVPGFRRHHALPALQQRGDDHRVGLGASRQEENLRLRRPAGGPDPVPGGGGIGIRPVAGGFDQIGFLQPLQDRRMGALHIVGSKPQFLLRKGGLIQMRHAPHPLLSWQAV